MGRPKGLFFGGLPTKIEVDRLMTKFGVPKEGEKITWQQVAEVISVPPRTNRFVSVVQAWRRLLFREHNTYMTCDGDNAIYAADPDTRVTKSAHKVANSRRAIARAILVTYQTDASRLSETKLRVREHLLKTGDKLRLAAKVM